MDKRRSCNPLSALWQGINYNLVKSMGVASYCSNASPIRVAPPVSSHEFQTHRNSTQKALILGAYFNS